jgi:hypothetical protein
MGLFLSRIVGRSGGILYRIDSWTRLLFDTLRLFLVIPVDQGAFFPSESGDLASLLSEEGEDRSLHEGDRVGLRIPKK